MRHNNEIMIRYLILRVLKEKEQHVEREVSTGGCHRLLKLPVLEVCVCVYDSLTILIAFMNAAKLKETLDFTQQR